MNEGYLGKFSFGGERAATDDHPVVIHYLPLAAGVTAPLAVGTLLKAVDVTDGEGDSAKVVDVAYAPFLSMDAAAVPCAVVDLPCDPTGDKGEKSAACVVHGTVKTRILKTGDDKTPNGAQLAKLAERGVFAV